MRWVLSNLATGGPLNKHTENIWVWNRLYKNHVERKPSRNSKPDYKMWLIPCPFYRHRQIRTLTYLRHYFPHISSDYCACAVLRCSNRVYTGLHIRCPRTVRVIYACARTRSKFKFEKADVGTMPTPYSIRDSLS